MKLTPADKHKWAVTTGENHAVRYPNKQDGGCSRKVRFSLSSLKFVMFLCKGIYNNLLHNFPGTQGLFHDVSSRSSFEMRVTRIEAREFSTGLIVFDNVRLLLSNVLFLLQICILTETTDIKKF
jgi:hypothetical protein